MSFITEPEPKRGVALESLGGFLRIVAPNSSVMTYHGTNTYLLREGEAWLVIDPGPDNEDHIAAIRSVTGDKVVGIILTHGHADHSGAAGVLQRLCGAPVYGGVPSLADGIHIDRALLDGERVGHLEVCAAPGHSPDHLIFAHSSGIVLTGDLVMGWASTVVRPPLGDMHAFMTSLQMLEARDDVGYLPGHGPPITENPKAHVHRLLSRRREREQEILWMIKERPYRIAEIQAALYDKDHPRLVRAAQANVEAHLLKLHAEGRAVCVAGLWSAI